MFSLTLQNESPWISTLGRRSRTLVAAVAAFLYDPDQNWIAERRALRVMSRLEFSPGKPG